MLVDVKAARSAIYRQSFYEFFKYFWSTLNPETPLSLNWHIKYLCNELQKVAEPVFDRKAAPYDLVINISPSSSKSTICSQLFPAWVWTRMPNAQFVCTSFKQANCHRDALKHKDVVTSREYKELFGEMELRKDAKATGKFINDKRGFRYSSTTPTGEHGHFIIVDDPLDPRAALSEKELANVNYWFDEVLPTRKVSKTGTPIILIMQRLHQDDPSGRMRERKGVKHICIPAEVTENVSPPELVPLYTEGGLMDANRMPRSYLQSQEALGSAYYASQFLQTPIPRGGGEFKPERIKISVPTTPFAKKVRYWDKAGTSGGGCFTVGALLAVDVVGMFWILDIVREQLDAYDREQLIQRIAMLDGASTLIGVEQEGGSGGKESAQATVRRLAGYRVHTDRVTGDKVTRAHPFAAQVNGANVRMLQASWNKALVEEMTFFPNSRYKDQVDALTGAFALLTTGIRVGGIFN